MGIGLGARVVRIMDEREVHVDVVLLEDRVDVLGVVVGDHGDLDVFG